MEDDKDDTDPVATACAIVIPTVFVAVVLTIMWRNGTLARAFEKAMQGASEALKAGEEAVNNNCLLYTSPSPRDRSLSRMPSSA